MDTIFALATVPGKSGVAVIRLSGNRAFEAAMSLCGDLPPMREARIRTVRNTDGAVIDEAVVIAFPAGGSFTGEKVVEFQTHGSPAIVRSILARFSDLDGLRLAEPGEFTRRALQNDRLDLAQVEGLADLIDAETEAQRRQAMRVFSGALGEKVASWRERLIRAAALLEATIDFADEDVPVDVGPEVSALLDSVRVELDAESRGAGVAERVREGFEVAIVGAPNVGKSTLLNRLAGRDAAITSEHAGTTRDVIEVKMDLDGIPVTVLDTAGLRESLDPVERIGIGRARQRALDADLRVFLVEERSEVPEIPVSETDIVVVGKSDLVSGGDVSGVTGHGVDALVDRIGRVLQERVSSVGVAVRERHRLAMEQGALAILDAQDVLAHAGEPEIAAEYIRRGVIALSVLIGNVDVEDLLDEVFSRFCLGK